MAGYSYNIVPGTSAESMALRRRLAEQLMAAGSSGAPIRHWAQGLNRVAQGLVGGYDAYEANKADAARRKQTQEMLSGLFGLGDENASPVAAAPARSVSPSSAAGPASRPMEAYAGTISGIESGGDYSQLGPVTKRGDRAYGKYQVMGANVGPWTKEVLGKEMSAQEFLANPQAQDAVFNAKFGQYAKKYGPEGAARAWFAGEGGMNDMGRKDQLGTTVSGYAEKFNRGMGEGGSKAAPRVASREKRRLRQAIAMINNPDTAALGNKILLDYLTSSEDTSGVKEYRLAQEQGYQGSFLDFQRELKGTSTKPTSSMQEYELAKQQGFNGSFMEFLTSVAGGEAGAKEAGKTQAEARAVLPAARTTVDNAFKTIKALRKHPGLDRATGIQGWMDPRNYAPGTVGADFRVRNQQAQSQAFMAAREGLKGAGQVTDFEGTKGEQAIANLTTAQSRKQYLEALDNLERMMKESIADLEEKAGISQDESRPEAPQPGQIEDGYRFKGGNPADPNSWERVQ